MGYLSERIDRHRGGLYRTGCVEGMFPAPDITNSIHPMFRMDRWLRGNSQMTEEIYARAKPALQLASLLITEDCMMWWWAHLVFGHPVENGSKHHIKPSSWEHSPQARAKAREAMDDMATVISILFVPRKHEHRSDCDAWGTTRVRAATKPAWAHEFQKSDWPRISRRQKRELVADPKWQIPIISLNHRFFRFYDHLWRRCTHSQRLRAQFMFATTLVHEVAHAYWFFLGEKTRVEPKWHPENLKSELGFCWEEMILGRIIDPLYSMSNKWDALFSVQTWMWHPDDAKRAAIGYEMMERFNRGGEGTEVRRVRCDRRFGSLIGHEWRGREYYGDEVEGWNFICIVEGIPISWISAWFRQSRWKKLREEWEWVLATYGEGRRRPQVPELGLHWSLGYQKDVNGREKMFESSIFNDNE